jgi:hypothetical protein
LFVLNVDFTGWKGLEIVNQILHFQPPISELFVKDILFTEIKIIQRVVPIFMDIIVEK